MLSIILITFDSMLVNFYKYQGTGNDFVIIDSRTNNIQLTENNIKKFAIENLELDLMD